MNLILSLILIFAEAATTTEATVKSVADGDTLCVQLADSQYKKVRLHGIDAPENDQEGGEYARNLLMQIALNVKITVHSDVKDPYGRILGRAELTSSVQDECSGNRREKTELNEYMLCKGAAWYYKRYEPSFSPDSRARWSQAFVKSRSAKIGIWVQPNPIPPWTWRQQHEPEVVPCP